jgi:hypothetical protein
MKANWTSLGYGSNLLMIYILNLKFYVINFGTEKLSPYSDSLRAGRLSYRIPVRARFSAPVQTGPGAYPASITMCTVSFSGVKRPGCGVDHPHSSSAKVKEIDLYIYSPFGPSWPVIGRTLPLPFYLYLMNFLLLYWCRTRKEYTPPPSKWRRSVYILYCSYSFLTHNFQGHHLFHYRKHGECDQPREGGENLSFFP